MSRTVWCLFRADDGHLDDVFRTLEAAKDGHTEAEEWTRQEPGFYVANDGWHVDRWEVIG